MASGVAWLDASVEEQRRVREVVALFSQKETQDELGGRRIVVALADTLFPGTSVLHTRARYLFFIPWLCERASRSKDPVKALEYAERELIGAFLSDDSLPTEDRLQGLIGREAGPRVRQLPTAAYWTALGAWGILACPGSPAETLDRSRHLRGQAPPGDADELAERAMTVWHHGVGEAPKTFPKSDLYGGFRLRPEEAEWLRERLLTTTSGSLLEHLVRTGVHVDRDSMPWYEEACLTAGDEVLAVLDDAHRFSVAADGARRLYDLLLAERYTQQGFDQATADPDSCVARIEEWVDDRGSESALFDGWDSLDFWTRVRRRNPNINLVTQHFFDTWFDVARTASKGASLADVVENHQLRQLVRGREIFLKGSQARLVNDKLLATWTGGAAAPNSFRWAQVAQLVNDLVDGLAALDEDGVDAGDGADNADGATDAGA